MRNATTANPAKASSPEKPLSISRRGFFQWLGLSGFLARILGTGRTMANPADTAEGHPDPQWLIQWRAANRSPVWKSGDPKIESLIRAARLNQNVRVRYFAGSLPGELREIAPSLVFTCNGYSAVWLSAWCHTRRQHRTFRCDSIQLA
jgi:predicted DNA-binding transcriptional regulator YafY